MKPLYVIVFEECIGIDIAQLALERIPLGRYEDVQREMERIKGSEEWIAAPRNLDDHWYNGNINPSRPILVCGAYSGGMAVDFHVGELVKRKCNASIYEAATVNGNELYRIKRAFLDHR